MGLDSLFYDIEEFYFESSIKRFIKHCVQLWWPALVPADQEWCHSVGKRRVTVGQETHTPDRPLINART
jgi:hypothetical protein